MATSNLLVFMRHIEDEILLLRLIDMQSGAEGTAANAAASGAPTSTARMGNR